MNLNLFLWDIVSNIKKSTEARLCTSEEAGLQVDTEKTYVYACMCNCMLMSCGQNKKKTDS
jgi:hypothetical protein